MREHPILFSTQMVRAILEGRKTVTRRPMKEQPFSDGYQQGDVCLDQNGAYARFSVEAVGGGGYRSEEFQCPYGDPRDRDRLWVREAWRVPDSLDACSGFQIAEKCLDAGYRNPWCPIRYEADGILNSAGDWHDFGSTPGSSTPGRYRHARFMPRWASRITLEVTGVRVERLQDISDEDCFCEGLRSMGARAAACRPIGQRRALNEWIEPVQWDSPRNAFRDLWSSINGDSSWLENPWVWVVEFQKVAGD